jgi:uncharacterized protein YbjT (DUF2867 family)
MADRRGWILLTGATGYVGSQLLPRLERQGRRVRCLAREPARLAGRVAPATEVTRGDAVTGAGLAEALRGVESAVYLIHSMSSASGFEEEDRRAARHFGAAARAAGVRRIVYLGGLADEGGDLSPHLRSRLEVGRLLRRSGVPVIELRASIVIGAGSLSFEMIRALVEHLPVLVTPRWVSMPAQPIGSDDLVAYLLEALDADPSGSPIYQIGGADRMSYADLMREYARQRGLRRWMLPVPVLTPRLSSLWLGLVTPLYARVGRKLIDGIRQPSVVRDDAARRVFSVTPTDVRSAMARAIASGAAEAAGPPRPAARRRWAALALALALALLASPAAPAAEIEGVRFAERQRAGDAELRLQGLGLLRYRVLFRGYVAALYLADGVEAARALADVPRRLEIEYFWHIPARAFAQATLDGVAANVDAELFARLRGRLERLNDSYGDIAPGDRYALTYVPGRGTELARNGEVLVSIPGADFAAALFAIWLGERPLDTALRAQLLAEG